MCVKGAARIDTPHDRRGDVTLMKQRICVGRSPGARFTAGTPDWTKSLQRGKGLSPVNFDCERLDYKIVQASRAINVKSANVLYNHVRSFK